MTLLPPAAPSYSPPTGAATFTMLLYLTGLDEIGRASCRERV
jgi:hypothetical protein